MPPTPTPSGHRGPHTRLTHPAAHQATYGFATHALGVFKISFGLVGGTELRILLALVNLVVLAKPRFSWDGHEVLVFDAVALGATAGVAFTALRSTAQVTKRRHEMERLD